MNLFRLLLLVFLIVPLVEIYILVKIGALVGAMPTVGLVVLTAVIGAMLIRAQGLTTLRKAQSQFQTGQPPALTLLEGAVIVLSGALLLTPGFVTDTVGFLCLIPKLRRWFITRTALFKISAVVKNPRPGQTRTIEGEFERHSD